MCYSQIWILPSFSVAEQLSDIYDLAKYGGAGERLVTLTQWKLWTLWSVESGKCIEITWNSIRPIRKCDIPQYALLSRKMQPYIRLRQYIIFTYIHQQEQEMDKLGLRLANRDSRAYRDLFPPQHLSLNLLNECSRFWANGMQSYSRTRRGGLCVYNIDARCSHTVKVDGQCFPEVEILTLRCRLIISIFAVAYIHPDAHVFVFILHK